MMKQAAYYGAAVGFGMAATIVATESISKLVLMGSSLHKLIKDRR
jgi:hypothetical protein